MEVTALCFRLLFYVLVFLFPEDQHCYCDGITDAASLHVAPNRLQFFEYESILISCEGFEDVTDWRVLRRTRKGVETTCGSSLETYKGPCTIIHAFSIESGEYWCEAGGNRSSSVNISITDGPVILESPALPVTEGDAVTLSCRGKMASSMPLADFYKDGALARTGYDGSMTIDSVSKSDEGLYRCVITSVGESAESWLAVRVSPRPSHHRPPSRFLLWVTVGLFSVIVPLLVLGLLLCKKKRASAATGAVHPAECSHVTQPVNYSEAVPGEAAGRDSYTTDEYVYYSTIDDVTEGRV